MLLKHMNDVPRPPRELRGDLPAGLAHGIERALAKKPADRWPDAAAFRDALSDDRPRAPASSAPAPRPVEPAPVPNAPAWPAQPPAFHRAVAVPPSQAAPPMPPRQIPPWLAPTAQPVDQSQPAIPPWMPNSWREARRDWRRYTKDQRRLMREQAREQRRALARGLMVPGTTPEHDVPVEFRIRAFRMHVARVGTSAAVLAGVNFFTSPFVPWFLVPAAFMSLSVLKRGGSLWAEGVRLRDIFGKDAKLPANGYGAAGPAAALGPPPRSRAPQRAAALVPADILAGPHGASVMRAAEDEAEILDAIGKLAKTDRDMIPDVRPTVDALVERVAALAQALHRLDHDVTPDTLARLDTRIAAAEAQPESSEREKKLTLLRRQRATLDDLLGRRESLVSQSESAVLMLQNIRIDLIALRAAGVQSSIDDVSGATQEARALSRDIGHVLEAAKQVRD
jgi:serine/threonine-protein kinase